jgi:uncharacterized membrane protein
VSRLATLPLLLFLAIIFPILFSELMFASLSKLHLSPEAALGLVISIFVGGLINIPVKAIVRDRDVIVDPLAIYGLGGLWPQLRRIRRTTVVAVNVGGCLIPAGVAVYELANIAALGEALLVATAMGCVVNTAVCYAIARPVPDVGIVMPALTSPLTAAVFAMLFVPGAAAPAAFVIGVIGPLLGADLLHLKDVDPGRAAAISIGGAGTFDGIILSGIVAAYLA